MMLYNGAVVEYIGIATISTIFASVPTKEHGQSHLPDIIVLKNRIDVHILQF